LSFFEDASILKSSSFVWSYQTVDGPLRLSAPSLLTIFARVPLSTALMSATRRSPLRKDSDRIVWKVRLLCCRHEIRVSIAMERKVGQALICHRQVRRCFASTNLCRTLAVGKRPRMNRSIRPSRARRFRCVVRVDFPSSNTLPTTTIHELTQLLLCDRTCVFSACTNNKIYSINIVFNIPMLTSIARLRSR